MRVSVYVLSSRSKPLMPASPPKARLLLKEKKAKVVKRTPFTIQLTSPSGESKQAVCLGVDSGYNHIGLSAITAKEEIYSADVKLRDDIVKLNSERRQYRRARRNRKSWYRKAKFLNRKKPEGWLAPSIQHKLNSHLKLIEDVKKILPIVEIVIEVAAFDIQKIKNPQIEGAGYQNGLQKGFWNVREYVLYRDGHICQSCKGKSKSPILEVHHIESRQTGSDRADNLITLCLPCHEKVSKGQLKLKVKPSKSFKAEGFMSTVRWKLVNKLKQELKLKEQKDDGNKVEVEVSHCYGYLTKQKRISLGLAKSHINDAFVIAKGEGRQKRSCGYLIQQVRKSNRKLFKGERSQLKNRAERFICGFQRFDKVRWKKKNIECFIYGRRRSGYFDLRQLDGTKVCASAKAKEISLLERAKSMLIERKTTLLPFLLDTLDTHCDILM